jgi:transcriptional regulator with XRE-family HTH domain
MGINQAIAIGKIVKKACEERGLSLNRLALSLGVNPIYLNNVLYGKKSSRPLIRRIAQVLHLPDLPQVYEEYLRTKRVENKNKTSSNKAYKKKSHKGGVS